MVLVSVVMPVLNGEKFISESIKSILSQTINDIELIIVDDGSTDGTGKIIQSITDDRIIYRRLEKNMGTATATNIGHEIACGKYIAHMDADDIALPHRLKTQALFLAKFPRVDVLGGYMGLLFGTQPGGVATAPTSDGEIKANFLSGMANIYNPTAMFRHSFLKEKKLKCDPTLRSAFDWGFWVQAMFQGARFANLDQVILAYRVHEGQQSKDLFPFRNELSRIRLSILELFYPNLTLEERITVEPLLQVSSPPSLSIVQVQVGLEVINKALTYKIQSRLKENRQKLQEFLEVRIDAIKRTLEKHFDQKTPVEK